MRVFARGLLTIVVAAALSGQKQSQPPEIVALVNGEEGRFQARPIEPALLAKIKQYTWRQGCPVALDQIVALRVSYWDFHAVPREGELLVNRAVSAPVLAIFRELFQHGFLIERMQPVEEYQGNDDLSMEANNTSAFNCRDVSGSPGRFSNHSWGRAIDINPLTNPYLPQGKVSPPEGAGYLDRTLAYPGGILDRSFIVNLFRSHGWTWGGEWQHPDYQHFELPDPARVR